MLGRKKRRQRGWMPAAEAVRRAGRAQRKAAIRAARKGKGPAPEYKETR